MTAPLQMKSLNVLIIFQALLVYGAILLMQMAFFITKVLPNLPNLPYFNISLVSLNFDQTIV